MRLVAVSDIFGKTESFIKLVNEISPAFSESELVTPYGNELNNFENEEEAYNKFSTEVGINSYTEALLSKLEGTEATTQLLLGFSVGATAIWLASENLGYYGNTKAICLYSSQIRNLLTVKPQIQTTLYFAKTEPRYQVDDVIADLEHIPNVNCCKTTYQHGFMNSDSRNYSAEGFHNYLKLIKKHIKSLNMGALKRGS